MAKSKKTTTRKAPSRPRPMVPKAGVTGNHRRYSCGGKLKTK